MIESAGVTVMQATPATWTLLLEGGWRGRPGLKALAGGEALPAGLAARLRERVGALWNVYGPTETTVWSTLHPVTAAEGRIPIGRPLANTTVHLLDAGGGPAPVGVGGELCIGGEGLARGYHGRPDLTAERFVPDPFGPPGSRLYRTGDLARRRAGGDLEYLGRIDHQVKVRGFRIELGEIDAALLLLPGVAQAAVVVREEPGGDRRLIAFLTVEPGAAPAVAGLREGLLRRLPDYMVPAAFVILEALPLNASGKVDRRALARRALEAGALAAPGEEKEYAAPRDPAEQALAGLWAELLGRERVGIHDRFFELGGDSILAIRLVARAQKAGLRFSPRQLFQHQTIAALAPVVEIDAGASVPRPTAFQRRLLALEPAVLRRWNDAVLIALPAGAGQPAVAAALAGLAGRHEALRLRFLPADGDWRLEMAPLEERVAVDWIDLTGMPGGPDPLALVEEARDRIDLAVRPWTAALFHRGGGEPDLLLLAVHRLAADGPSWEPLLADLRELLGGSVPPAPACRQAAGLATELLGRGEPGPARRGRSGLRRLARGAPGRLTGPGRGRLERSSPGRSRGGGPWRPGFTAYGDRDGAGRGAQADQGRAAAAAAGSSGRDRRPSRRSCCGGGAVSSLGEPLRPRPVFAARRTVEAVAGIVGGRLRIDWLHAEGAYRPEALRALTDAAASALRAWIHQRPAAEAGDLIPSDFPSAGLSQEALDDLLAELTTLGEDFG